MNCALCGVPKPDDEFVSRRGNPRTYCCACAAKRNAQHKAWKENKAERIKTYVEDVEDWT